MAGESPASVIVDGVNGTEVAVVDGVAIPVLTRALLVSGKDSGNVARFLQLTSTGLVLVDVARPTASTVTPIPQAVVTTTLLSLNAGRRGALVYNNAAVPLFVKLGAGASTTDFSVRMPAHATLELPFPVYTGLITGVWSAAGAGTAQVTETS